MDKIQPELSSPARFRIQGGSPERDRRRTKDEGRRKSSCLILDKDRTFKVLNVDFLHHLSVQGVLEGPPTPKKKPTTNINIDSKTNKKLSTVIRITQFTKKGTCLLYCEMDQEIGCSVGKVCLTKAT